MVRFPTETVNVDSGSNNYKQITKKIDWYTDVKEKD